MKKIIEKSTGLYLNALAIVQPKKLKRTGYNLFCNPFSKEVKPHHLAFLKTAEMFTFAFENKKIQGYKWGNGSNKVVLIHGWASNTFRWKKMIERLQKEDCTIYGFDAPAHGLSEGKLLNLLIYKKCFDAFIESVGQMDYAVSHSVGGFMLQYALYDNKKTGLKRIAILGAPGEAEHFFDFYKEVLSLNKRTVGLIKKHFEEKLGYHPAFFSAKRFAKEIDIPVLLVHDHQDKDTDPKYTEMLSSVIKENELIMTNGLGHNLKSDELNEKILLFLFNSPL